MKNINDFKTLKEVENYRKMVNEACDKRASYINLCIRANTLASKPFGFIKECMENFSDKLFSTENGRTILNKYSLAIQSDSNLHSLHTLYENVRKANPGVDVDYFVNNVTATNWNVSAKQLKEGERKLGMILAEAYLYLGEDAENYVPRENAKLDSALQYISENKRSNKNLVEFSSAAKVIRDFVTEGKDSENVFESISLKKANEQLISDFNKRFAKELNESDAKIIKEMISCKSHEDMFNKYKLNCINSINECKKEYEEKEDTVSSEKLQRICEQVSSKNYNEDTFAEDIFNLIEMSSVLK